MAAQQAQTVIGLAERVDDLAAVGADTRVAAVDQLLRDEPAGGMPRRFDAVASVGVHGDGDVEPGDADNVLAAERPAVQDDRFVRRAQVQRCFGHGDM
ncbi:hypothetical protein Lesp02_41010 [Lentzea sp. NBRC 105346]|nr:hypothetical protein Lesp02_41010 [Lentzea sp. NBRC 105346]